MSRPGSAFDEWVDNVPEKGTPTRMAKKWSTLSTILDLMDQPNQWAVLSPEVHINYGGRLQQAGRDSGVRIETCIRGNRVYAKLFEGSSDE